MIPRPAARMAGIERTLIRRIFESAPPGAINLGLGQPDLPTLDACALAGVAAIVDGHTSYTATAGDAELRARVAHAYAPFAAGPASVLVTVGSQEALFVACLALLDPGDELLYPDPGYPAYPIVARLVGARATPYPLRAERDFRLEPEDVLDRLGPGTRAVLLCAPHNPTGALIEPADLRRLIAELERREVAWISDEIYAAFVYERPFVSAAACSTARGGLVISGVSKDSSMTGWRVGFVVAAEDLVERLVSAHQYVATCAPSISQRAACAAFTPQAGRERRRYLARFGERRALMARELGRVRGLHVVPPDGAFYYFLDVRSRGDSSELARRALVEQAVITIPGQAFGERGAGWLRVSFACDERDLVEGLRRLARTLEASPRRARRTPGPES